MKAFLVANPKGGSGKSTLATNLAGYFASQRHEVMLGDIDRQQSAREWLAIRPFELPTIDTWEIGPDDIARPPKGTTHVVLDTPAGLHGKRLDEVMKLADKVIIPIQPSIFDIHATHAFVAELLAHRRSDKVKFGIVCMRVREGTLSAEHLRAFVDKLKVPLIGQLRDTQNYVHLAAHGLTLFDVTSSRFERDHEQWKSILEWVDA